MGLDRRKEIVKALENAVEQEDYLGFIKWAKAKDPIKTYELSDGKNKIWCAFIDGYKVGEVEPNKKIVYIAEANKTEDDILELNLPYIFSTRSNGAVYENDESIEIRMYGKFKFNKKNYKAEIFMNFLKDNGYSNEVRVDENFKEYVRVLRINKDLSLDLNIIKERFYKWLNVLSDYKEYNILVQG